MGECDMGCQPDWHHDECAIYLSDVPMTPAVPDPTVEALSGWFEENLTHDHFRDWSNEQFAAALAPLLAARAAAPDALRVRVEALAAEWESRPKPVTGWDSGLSATESGERLGQWNAFQRRAAELRALLEDGAQ